MQKKNVKKKANIQSVLMYTSLDIDKDCDLLHDRPVLSTWKTPHDKQKQKLSSLQSKSAHESGAGARRQDGPTDSHL